MEEREKEGRHFTIYNTGKITTLLCIFGHASTPAMSYHRDDFDQRFVNIEILSRKVKMHVTHVEYIVWLISARGACHGRFFA